MTTRKLSSERLLDCSLFKNLTRRRLSHVLVAFLVNFFTLSVPIMLTFGDYMEDWRGAFIHERETIISIALRNLNDIMVLNLVFTYIVAAYLGIVTLGYMMKRRSAHFYHALPERRETLYVTSIVSALVCYVIGYGLNVALSAGELAVFGVGYKELYSAFFSYVVNNLLVFLSTYAITVFAGTVSGNRIVQVLLTAVIMLYPLATYFGVLLMRNTYSVYFAPDYFFNESFIQWLSPFAHVIINYGATIKVSTTVLSLAATVLLLLGGLLIYKKRAIENSESPIVFKKLGSTLKYMFMFTITIYAGIFFYTIKYSAFSLIFGCISGAVLSFMLFNTILEKTPKAMFKNIKGLAIFAAAFAVYAAVFGFDIFKLDYYIPSENNISYVELDVDYATYDDNKFDDPEVIAALVELLENQQEANRKNIASPYDYDQVFSIDAVMHTKLGIPVSRRYNISKYTDGVEEFLKLYADDERMQAAYDKKIADISGYLGKGCIAEITVDFGNYIRVECPLDELMNVYLSEAPAANYDTLSRPAVGNFSVRYVREETYGQNLYSIYADIGDSSIFDYLPIYEDMTKTIAYLESLDSENIPASSDRLDNYTVTSAKVYDIRSRVPVATATTSHTFVCRLDVYPYKEIDEETAKALDNYLYRYDLSNQANVTRLFMAFDKNYIVEIKYTESGAETEDEKIGEIYDDEKYIYYGYEDAEVTVSSAITTQSVSYHTTLVFPKDMVPDYVKAMFE